MSAATPPKRSQLEATANVSYLWCPVVTTINPYSRHSEALCTENGNSNEVCGITVDADVAVQTESVEVLQSTQK
nr:unnamed protein product [Fasciola hepatica]